MPSVRLAVVAHNARADQAHTLFNTLGATYLSMDNGTLGCSANHRKTWTYLTHSPTQWGVCIEDDAIPVEGFTHQLEQALAVAPTPIVSMYLGQGRPPQWQQRVGQAIHTADQDNACWIVGQRLLHGVAVAIRTDLIPSMLAHTKISTQPIDYAIRDWAVEQGHDICFTWPSIVDHADGPTLIERDDSARTETRTAWRVGTRTRWTSKQVTL